jgi:hypothetical protein
MLHELRRAYGLYKTDNRADTVAALAILAVVAVPAVRTIWEVRTRQRRG